MTTLQEAARKALYALEASIDGDHPYYEDQLTAIESLRTALAQQGDPEVLAHDNCRAERICRSWCGNSACISHTAAPAPQQQESVCPECHCHFVGSDVTAPGSTRLVNTAPQSAQGGSVRVVSVDQLSLMFRNTNTDKDQWGHYHAKG